MNKSIAFFDVDGTLLDIKTMFSFLKFFLQEKSRNKILLPILKYYYQQWKTLAFYQKAGSRELINKKYYENFAGENVEEMLMLGKKWWQKTASQQNIFKHNVINELVYLQKTGVEIVLVSGSMPTCIQPFAEQLGIKHCLLTSQEILGSYYTGNILGTPNIAHGKKYNINKFLSLYPLNIDLKNCYAYGDHASDLPMLEMVGNPVVVGNDKTLIKTAKSKGWKIIH